MTESPTTRNPSSRSSLPPIPPIAKAVSSPSPSSRSGESAAKASAAALPWMVWFSNGIDRIIGRARGLWEDLGSWKEARLIRDFTETLELARDPSTIELALVRVAGRLAKAAFVELLLDPGQRAGETATTRIAGWPASALDWPDDKIEALGYPLSLGLWCGESRRLALQVFESPAERKKGRLTPRLVRRLTDLCVQAAAAERALAEKANREFEKNLESTANPRRSSRRDPSERFIPFPDPVHASRKMVHDATYLNAVLPFALAQASRHQEPLTVLLIETERAESGILSADSTQIQSGKIAANVARSLRASDAVVLLEDGRIIAVLPDTSATQAEHVVRIARSALVSNPLADPPEIFPRILCGLASYPLDAEDMPSLLSAADEAIHPSKMPARISPHHRAEFSHQGSPSPGFSVRPG